MRIAFVAVGLAASVLAQATTLTFTGVADDFFEAYLSTNDSVQGTLICAQTGTWQSGGATGSITLVANVTNYLHIQARDAFGAPFMMIGQASLSDAGFEFLNSTQSMLTNPNDWVVSNTGFGSNYVTPTDLGQNGTGAWGTQANVNINARRIWSAQATGEQYFSVAIRPVPEPLSLFGLAGVAFLAARKRKS